ncbi:MAG: enoyl-CoA hydratase/isomerase family protein [Austwickia sp.]|nr:enoyl-CoA hydratase/isomerase family protein [Austwickia sp.]MBK9101074.1 enoyl-CoA hydratase/isomerase family protein [Austwickia sp.]
MTLDSPHPHLRLHRRGPVLTVTLDHRARRNSQTPTMWAAFAQIATTLPDDVRVVVLAGAGPSFSAGLDRGMLAPGGIPGEPDLLAPAAAGDLDGMAALIAGIQQGFTAWGECHAIVIAAVQGYAVGAGFQLALAADLRVVAEDVQFIMGETKLGMVPDLGGTAPLVSIMGYPRALEIIATGRAVGAAEAMHTGLANLVVPAAELDQAVGDLADAILQAPDPTIRALKRVLRAAVDNPVADQVVVERTAQAPLLTGLARTAGPT